MSFRRVDLVRARARVAFWHLRHCIGLIPVFLLTGAVASAQVSVVPGYSIAPVITAGLNEPTGLSEDADGNIYIAEYAVGLSDRIGVSIGGSSSARDFATIPDLYRPSGVLALGPSVYITNRSDAPFGTGQVIKYTDLNGNDNIDGMDEYAIVFSDLPRGANGTRSIALGPDNRVYVGQGSIGTDSETEPLGMYNTTVFRFDPVSPQSRQLFASGFFNPLGIAFSPEGLAFISDRQPATEDLPDELNAATQGDFFGFGQRPGIPKDPLVSFPRFSQPAGVAYFPPSEFTRDEEVVFVALEGHPSYPGISEPAPRVVRVTLQRDGDTLSATVSDFVTGLRPFGLLRSSDSGGRDSLLITDHHADLVYEVTAKDLDPRDVDQSGFVDAGDLYVMVRERNLAALGTPPDPMLTDFDENGVIDADDLFYLSEGWEGNPE
jgi:glucose/arabinose dehydrogenase